MADEEKNQEQDKSTVTDSVGVPEAFAKADKELQTELDKQPSADDVVTDDIEISDTETEIDVPAGTEIETEQAAEVTETLKEIDEDVLDVMRDYYDDSQIAELTKTNPELFEAVREELDGIEEPPAREPEPEQPEKTAEQEFEELKLELDEDLVKPEIKGAIDTIASRLNDFGRRLAEQGKGLDEEKAKLQAQKDEAYNKRIDSCFDRNAKQLAVNAKKAGEKLTFDLGNSSSFEGKEYKQLTRPERRQVNLRMKIFRHAQVESELSRIPIEKAIDIEINRHINQGGEKAAEQRVLNKLERQQETYTNRPTRRLSKKMPTFADEAEKADYLMKIAEEEAGLAQ